MIPLSPNSKTNPIPWEILGMSIGIVNNTTKIALKRTFVLFSIHARKKESTIENAVAHTVVTTEFLSIGKNCGDEKILISVSIRIVLNRHTIGITTVTNK